MNVNGLKNTYIPKSIEFLSPILMIILVATSEVRNIPIGYALKIAPLDVDVMFTSSA